jgi:hypothetical protein
MDFGLPYTAAVGLHGGLDESPRVHRIVEIVAERIRDRVGHDDRAGKMDDGAHGVLVDDAADEVLVADVAFDQERGRWHRRAKSRRQVVDDHDVVAGVEKRQHHMAADVSGAACHEYGHGRRIARKWLRNRAARCGDGYGRVVRLRCGSKC